MKGLTACFSPYALVLPVNPELTDSVRSTSKERILSHSRFLERPKACLFQLPVPRRVFFFNFSLDCSPNDSYFRVKGFTLVVVMLACTAVQDHVMP